MRKPINIIITVIIVIAIAYAIWYFWNKAQLKKALRSLPPLDKVGILPADMINPSLS